MIKTYSFNYDFHKAFADFEVDTKVFTEVVAQETLDFFTWDYDNEENPIDAVLKKYALEVIHEATSNNYNTHGVISAFDNKEGFCRLDGSNGIKLTYVEKFEFDEDDLEMKVTIKNN